MCTAPLVQPSHFLLKQKHEYTYQYQRLVPRVASPLQETLTGALGQPRALTLLSIPEERGLVIDQPRVSIKAGRDLR